MEGIILDKQRTGDRAEGFAHDFYISWAWIRCARAYKQSVNGLCERCAKAGLVVPGTEVHHRIHLTPDNINDPRIAYDWSNLICLCKDCHIKEHEHDRKRWRADKTTGHVEIR